MRAREQATTTRRGGTPHGSGGVVLLGLVLAACGGGGGDGAAARTFQPSTSDPGLQPPTLNVLATSPADGAVQVPADSVLEVRCDAAIARESLRGVDAPVVDVASGAAVAGGWSFGDGDTVAYYRPATPWPTDRRFRLSLPPLLAGADGRLLEDSIDVEFATTDTRPPRLLGGDHPEGALLPARARAVLRLDEPLAEDTGTAQVRDRDSGERWAASMRVDGAEVLVGAVVDLPGARRLEWVVDGLADLTGNRVATPLRYAFETGPDQTAPRIVDIWPDADTAIAPGAALRLTFDESIDAGALDGTVTVTHSGPGDPVPVDVHATADQRTLWFQPRHELPAGTTGALWIGTAFRDLSGNTQDIEAHHGFHVGSDDRPPRWVASSPAAGAGELAASAIDVIRLDFDEALDPASIRGVRLASADGAAYTDLEMHLQGGRSIVLEPGVPLADDTDWVVRVPAGPTGVRDLAGNPLADPVELRFRTAPAMAALALAIWPADRARRLPRNSTFALHADRPLDRASCSEATVRLLDADGRAVPCRRGFERGDRVYRLTPDALLEADTVYRVEVTGGGGRQAGLRAMDGAALPHQHTATVHVGPFVDTEPPVLELTLDAIDTSRNTDLGVAPFGFVVDLSTPRLDETGVDWSTLDLELSGAAGAPDAPALFAALRELRRDHVRLRLPREFALAAGDWTLRATLRDVAGNASAAATLRFTVLEPTLGRMPFERTQVVWVRTDLDRDGSGQPDFAEDLRRIGLATAGDPSATNAALRRLVARGIARRANLLYERAADGGRRADGDSVPIVFSADEPPGVAAMEIACGGFDPEGESGRSIGDASSGVLGRAWFDRVNAAPQEHAISTSPGLGVFPGEVLLFEARVHLDVYPSFVTSFARHFLPLSPALGGTPAGADPLDARVLAPDFDPQTATAAERARRATILDAADAWSTVIGTVVAHEVGHAVGLVATGAPSDGLHGDQSLHNRYADLTDVMASTLGFDAILSLDYRFRDLNFAYLRQRVLLR